MPFKDYLKPQPPVHRRTPIKQATPGTTLASSSTATTQKKIAELEQQLADLKKHNSASTVPAQSSIDLVRPNTPLLQTTDVEAPPAVKSFELNIPVKKTYLGFISLWHLETILVKDSDDDKQNLDIALSNIINNLDDTISACDTIPKYITKIGLSVASILATLQLVVNSQSSTDTNTPSANNSFNVISNYIKLIGGSTAAIGAGCFELYRGTALNRRTQALDARTQLAAKM